MVRTLSPRKSSPLVQGTFNYTDQRKQHQKEDGLKLLPPPLVHQENIYSKVTCSFGGSGSGSGAVPHLISPRITSIFGTAQNRWHGGKLSSWQTAWKVTVWLSPLTSETVSGILREERQRLQTPHEAEGVIFFTGYWTKRGQNITSCFVKSSLLISFVFTICVQKWSVSFWGSEGAFQFKMTFSCFLFHVRNEGGSYFSLIQASKMFPSWQLCWK